MYSHNLNANLLKPTNNFKTPQETQWSLLNTQINKKEHWGKVGNIFIVNAHQQWKNCYLILINDNADIKLIKLVRNKWQLRNNLAYSPMEYNGGRESKIIYVFTNSSVWW